MRVRVYTHRCHEGVDARGEGRSSAKNAIEAQVERVRKLVDVQTGTAEHGEEPAGPSQDARRLEGEEQVDARVDARKEGGAGDGGVGRAEEKEAGRARDMDGVRDDRARGEESHGTALAGRGGEGLAGEQLASRC
jgi:hypothetical protein